MLTQKKIKYKILQLIKLVGLIIFEIFNVLVLMVKWTIRKIDKIIVVKLMRFNNQLKEVIYQRAIQTFNYTENL